MIYINNNGISILCRPIAFDEEKRKHKYLIDILTLKGRDQRGKTVRIGFGTDGFQKGLDIIGSGGSIATSAEQKISSEVLHVDW
jgi:hypothetical protein